MVRKYSIYEISNWFLRKEPMTHKKLQKMCYYAVAWNYALRDEELVTDTTFQAWVHGPVSPVLYEAYKGSGLRELGLSDLIPGISDITSIDDIEFLESVYVTYKDLGPNALEVLTHTEIPWQKARLGCAPEERCTNIISPEDMKHYYRSIYEGSEDGAIE